MKRDFKIVNMCTAVVYVAQSSLALLCSTDEVQDVSKLPLRAKVPRGKMIKELDQYIMSLHP